MSTRERRRAEVLRRVKSQTLRLVDAAKMLELSYRQTKRLADTPRTTPNQKKRDTSEVGKGTFLKGLDNYINYMICIEFWGSVS